MVFKRYFTRISKEQGEKEKGEDKRESTDASDLNIRPRDRGVSPTWVIPTVVGTPPSIPSQLWRRRLERLQATASAVVDGCAFTTGVVDKHVCISAHRAHVVFTLLEHPYFICYRTLAQFVHP